MTAPLHVIAGLGSGQLATIAHPRADAWPAEKLGELADAGVSVLVSALTTAEQESLGLGDAAEAAAEVGMDFISFPAEDEGIPRDEATKVVLLSGRLAANVRAGRFVVTQCFAGVGRTTLLACTTLVLLGVAPSEALRRVAGGPNKAGGPNTAGGPNKAVTRDWLHELARHRATHL